MNLRRTTALYFIGQIIISVSGFAVTFAIAVVGGSSVLGTYAVAVSLGAFLLIVPMQAVGSGIRKRMSEGTEQATYFSAGLVINVVVVLLICATLLLVQDVLTGRELSDLEIVIVLREYTEEIVCLTLAATVFRTVRAGMEGSKMVGESGLLQGGERVLRSLFQVGALFMGYGVGVLLIGQGMTLVITAVIGAGVIRISFETPEKRHFRRVLSYAKYAWLGTLRTRIYGWLDTFVLSFFVSASLIGIYEAAWGLASLLGIISGAIRRTLFPEMSELSTNESFDRINMIVEDGLAFSGIFVIPGLFGGAVLGQRVLRFYSVEFSRGAGILVILTAAYAADVYGSQFINLLNGIDRPDLAYRINAAFIISSLLLNVVLIWLFSWYGAAVATALSSVVRTALAYFTARRALDGIRVPVADIGREVIAALVMTGLIIPIAAEVPRGRAWTVLLVLFGAIIYLGFLMLISRRVRTKATLLAPGWLREFGIHFKRKW